VTERILLVEDNRDLAENVAEILSEEGLHVTICHDAVSAEASATACDFDLAILDIRLAGEDVGLELVPRLQQLSPHAEVLLITGNASLDSAIRAIRRGVYAYLTKPFVPDHLVALVKRALAQVALKRDRHALSQRLAASEALYRSVVESVESCIVGLDATGAICFWNRFAGERLGAPAEALLGHAFLDLCLPHERREAERQLKKALAGTPVRDHEFSTGHAGQRRRIRWTLTPLTKASLAAVGQLRVDGAADSPVLLAAGIDVTDRLELERKTAEAEAMAAMGALTTALAHEIRNPLNAAKLQLELFARRARKLSDAEARALLEGPAEIVRDEMKRLGALLDEFLDLARPRQIERHELLVRELFEEVSKLEAPVLERHRVTLVVELEPDDLVVRGDRDKLKQVLINLMVNAVEALEHTSEPRIQLRAYHDDKTVSLCVSDNGPGVPAELLGSAFTPFVTSKASGTGLGLAIVQKIARQHGGFAELVALPRGVMARINISA
jgi:PAS domain S-box-containing protein